MRDFGPWSQVEQLRRAEAVCHFAPLLRKGSGVFALGLVPASNFAPYTNMQ